MTKHGSRHLAGNDLRRHRYSALPVSIPKASSFRLRSSTQAAAGLRLRRENAFRVEPHLSPVSLAISSWYAKSRRPLQPEAVFAARESPERVFFSASRQGTPRPKEYKLKFKSPLSPGYCQSPPSSPSPPTSNERSNSLSLPGIYQSSPLSAPPSSIEYNDATSALPVSEVQTVSNASGADRPLSSLPILEVVDCKSRKNAIADTGIYVLENGSPSGQVRVFHLREPNYREKVSFHYCGDSIEKQVIRLGLGEDLKTYHSLNLQTDLNIPIIDRKKMDHYALVRKVLGWTNDSGITLSEFESFCVQCSDCKLYASRRSLDCSHACPVEAGDGLSTTIALPSRALDDSSAPQTSPRAEASQVPALWERFHAPVRCTGITAEEMQYLFVVCWRCEKVMTRTAAVNHVDGSEDDECELDSEA